MSDDRLQKLQERVNKLMKVYGTKNLLQAMISRVDELEKQEEEKGRGELPNLRLLSIDLTHTLNNYERRYDILDYIEAEDDESE